MVEINISSESTVPPVFSSTQLSGKLHHSRVLAILPPTKSLSTKEIVDHCFKKGINTANDTLYSIAKTVVQTPTFCKEFYKEFKRKLSWDLIRSPNVIEDFKKFRLAISDQATYKTLHVSPEYLALIFSKKELKTLSEQEQRRVRFWCKVINNGNYSTKIPDKRSQGQKWGEVTAESIVTTKVAALGFALDAGVFQLGSTKYIIKPMINSGVNMLTSGVKNLHTTVLTAGKEICKELSTCGEGYSNIFNTYIHGTCSILKQAASTSGNVLGTGLSAYMLARQYTKLYEIYRDKSSEADEATFARKAYLTATTALSGAFTVAGMRGGIQGQYHLAGSLLSLFSNVTLATLESSIQLISPILKTVVQHIEEHPKHLLGGIVAVGTTSFATKAYQTFKKSGPTEEALTYGVATLICGAATAFNLLNNAPEEMSHPTFY